MDLAGSCSPQMGGRWQGLRMSFSGILSLHLSVFHGRTRTHPPTPSGVPMAVRMALLAPESPTLCAFFGLFQPRLKSPTGHPSAPGLRPDLPRFGSTAVTQNQQNWSCWSFPSTVPTQGPCLSPFSHAVCPRCLTCLLQ